MPSGQPNQLNETIRLRGVSQNNLKNIDINIPLGKLIVVTGLSGSGKSSLVFETLHAEGQRRYVETFSPYTRQFLEMMDRPDVGSIENIPPSIAIQQRTSISNSRSTVGTMTELCDYFKVWFCNCASLFDPVTGEAIEDDSPLTIWRKIPAGIGSFVVCFRTRRPPSTAWCEILEAVRSQGFSRILVDGDDVFTRISTDTDAKLAARLGEMKADSVAVVVDRMHREAANELRFIDAARTALRFGKGRLEIVRTTDTRPSGVPIPFSEGLNSAMTGEHFERPSPSLFSFNSPIGACGTCRGFGRIIGIDESLVIPDSRLSIADGAIRPFQGEVYGSSLDDLKRAAPRCPLRLDVPWDELTDAEKSFVWEGEDGFDDVSWNRHWYGIRRFFKWLESNVYKMHVRVFLSRFRSYTNCPDCGATRLKPEALNWRWNGLRLPDLYGLPITELRERFDCNNDEPADESVAAAREAIRTRLGFLCEVGLGYLTLDRTSRSLSGGEIQRINLTACLGTSLTETLFILDEPSVGLHDRDVHRLVKVLRQIRDGGNTVIVVEHDESIMRAADWIIEVGPEAGKRGGAIVYNGPMPAAGASVPDTLNFGYLFGERAIGLRDVPRPVLVSGRGDGLSWLGFEGIECHNIRGVDVRLPLRRLVCITGVSGSGKSTLLNEVIHEGLRNAMGERVESDAKVRRITGLDGVAAVDFVDQSRVGRTPRSNPALFVEAWDEIRKLLARTDDARRLGLTPGHFSFNAGDGRCPTCKGLGAERVEMQFLADVFIPCPDCGGKRFRNSTLSVRYEGLNVAELLDLEIDDAIRFFESHKVITGRLSALSEVGLGYLRLGQPLNTLSGGESQRLKLARQLGRQIQLDQLGSGGTTPTLILLDEPTTGLHRHDIARLLRVLDKLVDQGTSVFVIEHQADVIRAADWVVELGPEGGAGGGRVVFEGTPEELASASTHTAQTVRPKRGPTSVPQPQVESASPAGLVIRGAREHNLRNLSLTIPHRQLTVVTGVSGSGKSSLAFDVIFAEGQRRFLESMSTYARQFAEQLPRAQIDALLNVPPAVAIEQRVTRGNRKSTVATVTEVAQYLRLLFARIGTQFGPDSGLPVTQISRDQLIARFESLVSGRGARRARFFVFARLVHGRKGHHEPTANWAKRQEIPFLRCDGKIIATSAFSKLARYQEHNVDAGFEIVEETDLKAVVAKALQIGNDSIYVFDEFDPVEQWLSTRNADPLTGETFPALEPKHFSWNSPRGWCPFCRGFGVPVELPDDVSETSIALLVDPVAGGEGLCPECQGTRLNRIARNVRLFVRKGVGQGTITLPELLRMPPDRLLETLSELHLGPRETLIAQEIIPEIRERLRFMSEVGLDYLPMDRNAATLSGGEAQRIRLASQLGTNLTGVLYVLDEPSIGLHARDGIALIQSLKRLRDRGNTLVVVEHDIDMMRASDHLIELGPGAGIHGGELVADGPFQRVAAHPASLTRRLLEFGMPHPLRNTQLPLPKLWSSRSRPKQPDWLVLREPALRNLKGGDLCIALNRLNVVCGVSGAGKSTLIMDGLHGAVKTAISRRIGRLKPGPADQMPFAVLINGNVFDGVIVVDQDPIGKTPRSIPATYIGVFDLIRQAFAELPDARRRGLTASAFSFNNSAGRCQVCKGAGRIKLEMAFMPDTWMTCEVCNGKRYAPDVLEARWNGCSIADVLEMPSSEAARFFASHPKLSGLMELMTRTGLGYIRLGQPSPTLSGGEAQRLKIVAELAKGLPNRLDRSVGRIRKNLYLLEEPTTGLHSDDCQRLLVLLHELVDQGHTVVVIEHNLDVIAEADWLVELGPEAGHKGGEIIFQGTPSQLANHPRQTPTRPFLLK